MDPLGIGDVEKRRLGLQSSSKRGRAVKSCSVKGEELRKTNGRVLKCDGSGVV